MIKVISVTLVALVVGILAWRIMGGKVATIMEIGGSRRYLDPQFGGVSKTPNIVYRSAPAYKTNAPTSLSLDLYQPIGDTRTGRPALVLVHGGGFATGNKGIYDEAKNGGLFGWGKYFAERGYVVFSVDYRLGDKFLKLDDPELEKVVEMATSDVVESIRYIKENAEKYRVDPNKIAVGGNSAGAVLALYSAYNPGSGEKVAASIALAGTIGPDHLERIVAGAPPAIMFAGTDDRTVPYTWSMAVKDKLKAVGSRVDWYSYPGVGHEVAGYTQVAPQIASFLYEVMKLDRVELSPEPASHLEANKVASPIPSPSPTPSPSLNPSPSPSPGVIASVAPSVKPSVGAPVKPSKKPTVKIQPSPSPIIVLERMAPEDFVWHGAPESPVIESNAGEIEQSKQGVLGRLWTAIKKLFGF